MLRLSVSDAARMLHCVTLTAGVARLAQTKT